MSTAHHTKSEAATSHTVKETVMYFIITKKLLNESRFV